MRVIGWLLAIGLLTSHLYAESYQKVIAGVEKALALRSADALVEAAGLEVEAAKGRNLPSLDAHLSAAYLKETPLMMLHFDTPGLTPIVPVGKRQQWHGDLTLSYPLFSGFAITATIDKAAYEHALASLRRDDLKRNLYLQATRLYTAIDAANKILKAQEKAKEAIEEAYQKAKGLYDNGLLPPADLYNIEAKQYAIKTELLETKTRKSQLLNQLSYLLNHPVTDVDTVKMQKIGLQKERIVQTALASREDIRALKTALKIDETMETLAKSRFYPTVGVAASLKRQGDTIALDGDGYTNADRSYAGATLRWNLFDGFSDKKRVEAVRRRILAAQLTLHDYEKRIAMEINNAFLELSALDSKLKSAQKEVKAREAYCQLTSGRFENQLAGADELSRAIADLAAARSNAAIIEGALFEQRVTILLMGGLREFHTVFAAADGA